MPRLVFASRVMTRLYGRGWAGATVLRPLSPGAREKTAPSCAPVRDGDGEVVGAGEVVQATPTQSEERAMTFLVFIRGGEENPVAGSAGSPLSEKRATNIERLHSRAEGRKNADAASRRRRRFS
jgi:hypothetical protein